MSRHYKVILSKNLERNKFVTYVPCATNLLNLVRQCAINCCLEADTAYFFSSLSNQWRILKDCIISENILKSLSVTRQEAYAMATEAVLSSYSSTLDALDCTGEDDTQKRDVRKVAESIANKMYEL